jgi:hypothetical protein
MRQDDPRSGNRWQAEKAVAAGNGPHFGMTTNTSPSCPFEYDHIEPPDTSKISLDEVMAAIREDEGIGFCTACGTEADGFVEPDTERRACQDCDERAVYGAEQLLLYMVP